MQWDLFLETLKEFPRLVDGALLTAELVGLSVLAGFVLAIPIALSRLARSPLLWAPAYGYIWFFRGTPLLLQIYMLYYGTGQFPWVTDSVLWPVLREAYWCALISFTLNTAAYQAEVLRGAILGVPHGEVEAARACGMSGALVYRRIVLPKAFRLALPAYSNEVVFLFQATSLASIITLLDLTGIARIVVARSFAVYEIYLTAALIYLVITYGILFIFKRVEFKLSGHLRPRPGTEPAPARPDRPGRAPAPAAGTLAVR